MRISAIVLCVKNKVAVHQIQRHLLSNQVSSLKIKLSINGIDVSTMQQRLSRESLYFKMSASYK